MEFSRRGPDQRRRRVVLEDRLQGSSAQAIPGVRKRSSAAQNVLGRAGKSDPIALQSPLQGYTPEALGVGQLRVADLLPTRCWTLWVLFLTGMCVVFGLDLLYLQRHAWRLTLGRENLTGFDLAQRGSLSAWFSSLLLLGVAGLSGVIYSLRRHRNDDYRGRYRLWIWVLALMLLASADTTANLQGIFKGVCLALWAETGHAVLRQTALPAAEGEIWWLLAPGLAWVGLGVMMGREMIRSRGSVILLCIAGGLYCGHTIFHYQTAPETVWGEWMPTTFFELAMLGGATCKMCGHLCLHMSIAIYARYVYLDAQGALPPAAGATANKSVSKIAAALRKTEKPKSQTAKAPTPPKQTPPSTPSNRNAESDVAQKGSAAPVTNTERKASVAEASKKEAPKKLDQAVAKKTDTANRKAASPATTATPAPTKPSGQANPQDRVNQAGKADLGGDVKESEAQESASATKPSKSERRRLRKEKRREKKRPAA